MHLFTCTGYSGTPVNISHMVALARGGGGAPLSRLSTANITDLGPHQTATQPVNGSNSATRSVGLITCASVIYASASPVGSTDAYVHHANSGSVSSADAQAALQVVGGPAGSVLVVIGIARAWDDGYDDTVKVLTGLGVPDHNIVGIEGILTASLGIDGMGTIGV